MSTNAYFCYFLFNAFMNGFFLIFSAFFINKKLKQTFIRPLRVTLVYVCAFVPAILFYDSYKELQRVLNK